MGSYILNPQWVGAWMWPLWFKFQNENGSNKHIGESRKQPCLIPGRLSHGTLGIREAGLPKPSKVIFGKSCDFVPTGIIYNLGYQMAPLASVPNLATRWLHLHLFQIWSPDGATYICSKFGHQMAPLESLALPHCLGLPYWHYQLVLSWYLHQPESHQLNLVQGL